MSAIVSKIPDEPIVLMVIDGKFRASDAEKLTGSLMRHCPVHCCTTYFVADLRKAQLSFAEVMQAVHTLAETDWAHLRWGLNIRPVFVGEGTLPRIIQESFAMPEFGGLQIPMFDNISDTMKYIHEQRLSDTGKYDIRTFNRTNS